MKSDKIENMSDKSDEERDRDRRGRRERQSRFSGSNDRDRSPRKKKGNRVFVSNIPYEYRWQELKDLFREQIGEVTYVELFMDENDKPRGCGIIEFANADLAKEAIEKMHRHELKGRKLVVKEDNDVERDKYGRILQRGGSGGTGGGGGGSASGGDRRKDSDRWSDLPSLVNGPSGSGSKWGNTYGLSAQFLESLNITGNLVPRCFVANLDYKVDDKKLKEVFRLAGRVISAEISLDKEGKSRGFGVVEYEHPVEAVQAISMLNNQLLYDRRLSVRMDRVDKGDGLPPKLPEGLKGIGMGLGANGVPLQDVARNLPSSASGGASGANSASAAPAVPVPPVNHPALAAAALVGNLMGGGVGGDLTSLTSPFGGSTSAALGGANSLAAAQLLSSATGNNALNAFNSSTGGGRDFDSLSAALSGGGGFNTGGGSLDRNRSLGSNVSSGGAVGGVVGSNRPSDSIILKNLPAGTTWQMLRDKCRDSGDVKFAEMRGKDTGIVQFASQWDAQRAVNMLDGMRIDGRIVDVRFY